ncbi:MAG: hypothetical protein ACYC2H_10660 [Thermoplasmatota archaeon]
MRSVALLLGVLFLAGCTSQGGELHPSSPATDAVTPVPVKTGHLSLRACLETCGVPISGATAVISGTINARMPTDLSGLATFEVPVPGQYLTWVEGPEGLTSELGPVVVLGQEFVNVTHEFPLYHQSLQVNATLEWHRIRLPGEPGHMALPFGFSGNMTVDHQYASRLAGSSIEIQWLNKASAHASLGPCLAKEDGVLIVQAPIVPSGDGPQARTMLLNDTSLMAAAGAILFEGNRLALCVAATDDTRAIESIQVSIHATFQFSDGIATSVSAAQAHASQTPPAAGCKGDEWIYIDPSSPQGVQDLVDPVCLDP